VINRFSQLQQQPLPGMTEAVPAYSSLTIHYDIRVLRKKIPAGHTAYEWMEQQLREWLSIPVLQQESAERQLRIPVCYEPEFAGDLGYLAATKNISEADIIQLHTAKSYKVYMLGFLPGFSYMGEVDERISIARKPQPEKIDAGSVGIAGKQTGIYPLASPGGWQIIGRTPLKLFDAKREDPILLRAGDSVQFYAITKKEFDEIKLMES